VSTEPDSVFGWKDIAHLLQKSVRAAQTDAKRDRDPLPVRVGHRGVWAHVSALRDWVMRQDVAYTVALRRGRERRETRASSSRREPARAKPSHGRRAPAR
jgi:hypothetical protein